MDNRKGLKAKRKKEEAIEVDEMPKKMGYNERLKC
jgi:hypothetical protein